MVIDANLDGPRSDSRSGLGWRFLIPECLFPGLSSRAAFGVVVWV